MGGEINVAPPTARSTDAAVSCGKTGTFAVAWHTDKAPASDRLDIVVRHFTQAGRPQAAAVRVNTVVDGDPRSPAISHDAAGNFLVVWRDGTLKLSGQRYKP